MDVIEILTQGLVIGLALAIVVRLALLSWSNLNAATKFAIWFATLLLTAALPLCFFARTKSAPIPRAKATITERAASHTRVVASGAPVQPEPARVARESRNQDSWRLEILLPKDVASAIPAIYALMVLLLFARLGVAYLRVRWLEKRARPAPLEIARRLEFWLNRCPTARPVRVLLSPAAGSPMAVGFLKPVILIPEGLLLQLTREEFDHVGVHELAHLRRYDDWTRLTEKLIQAVLFFNPAVHWIVRNLNFEREVACDDWVLAGTGRPKEYARSLARMVELTPRRSGPVLASGALFRKRQIFRRVQKLLDGSREARPGISPVAVVLVLLCLIGAVSQLVHLPDLVAFGEGSDLGLHRSRWTSDGRTIEIEMRGEVQFGDDDISIVRISPGGYVRVQEMRGWYRRKLEARPDSSGRPEIRYWSDSAERSLDTPGREWVRTILPALIRETGINAEERANRILETRGASALLEEVDRISGDHVRRRYLSALIQSAKVTTDDFRRAMNRVARISSDHDKAEMLKLASQRPAAQQSEVSGALVQAIASIQSDHDKANTICSMLEERVAGTQLLADLLHVTETIQSDHDKSRVLERALRHDLSPASARSGFSSAVHTIQSAHDRARVLLTLLESPDLDEALLEVIAHSAEGIQSDHDKANVLARLAARHTPQGLFAAIRSISSDHDKRRVLSALLEGNAPAGAAKEVVDLATTISSDHDKAEVLAFIAENYREPEVREAIRKAANTIQSDSDYRRVVSKMLNAPENLADKKRGR
jgi:beta-lactamase regulating signal transducer with metallopeptidase domain